MNNHGDAGRSACRVARAVAEGFAGDRELYAAFAALCQTQFRIDLRMGDEACAAGDSQALEQLGHNLKTVLGSLGFEAASEMARRVEIAAHAQARSASEAAWHALRDRLHTVIYTLQADGGR